MWNSVENDASSPLRIRLIFACGGIFITSGGPKGHGGLLTRAAPIRGMTVREWFPVKEHNHAVTDLVWLRRRKAGTLSLARNSCSTTTFRTCGRAENRRVEFVKM